MDDLTAIFYTANVIDKPQLRSRLVEALNGTPLISVSQRRMDFGQNIVVDMPRHHLSICKQALVGARAATTPYIALAEDDALYSAEHFKYRPTPGKFAYNIAGWGVYTWNPSMFSWKGRRNLWGLICERELFIAAMEERFAKYDYDNTDINIWAEPGKYERQLGVTVRETETFWTNPPNIIFSHEDALSFEHLGTRKRLGELRAIEIPYWGRVEQIMELYNEV